MFNISPRFLLGARQSFYKGDVFGALETPLQGSVNLVFVTRGQGADSSVETKFAATAQA